MPSPSDEDHDDLRGKVNELHDNRKNQKNLLVHRRTRRFVKVVSQGEAMPYNTSTRRNGYDQIKGTSANSDRERCGADDIRGPQWEPRSVNYDRSRSKSNKGHQRGTVMRYRSRTKSNP